MKTYNGITKEDFLVKIQEEYIPELWGYKGDLYKPYLCKNTIGDGELLIRIIPLSTRPLKWFILIDSSTNFDDDNYDIEDILEIIEEECGRWCWEEYENNENFDPQILYPQILWDGGSYSKIVNFKTGEFFN